MKDFPQFTKQQLELIIAAVSMSWFQLADDNLSAQLMVDFEYSFEHFGFPQGFDKRKLSTEPQSTSHMLFNPIIESLITHYEALPS